MAREPQLAAKENPSPEDLNLVPLSVVFGFCQPVFREVFNFGDPLAPVFREVFDFEDLPKLAIEV